MLSSYRQPIFGALRDQASDVILTGIPEQQRAITRDRRISDQPESGKHDEVLQMFSLNVDLLTNLPIRPTMVTFGPFMPTDSQWVILFRDCLFQWASVF